MEPPAIAIMIASVESGGGYFIADLGARRAV